MSRKDPIKLAFESIPFSEFFVRLKGFVINPEIKSSPLHQNELRFALKDFVESLLLVTPVIAFVKYVMPTYFKINPISLFNPFFLVMLLGFQTLIFSFILNVMAAMALSIKSFSSHSLLFRQAIRSYAILNLIISVMFAIAINRVIITGDITHAENNFDLWLGGILGIGAFLLLWRTLFKPIVGYFLRYYRKSLSYILTTLVIIATLYVVRFINFDFVRYVIDRKELCEQIVPLKYGKGIEDGKFNKDCLIGKCIEGLEKL